MIVQNLIDLSGQQFGNYELESLLKRRAATDLYLARDSKLDQPAFVEVLRTPVSDDPELAGRFQRRMETVSQIKKPNIASVIETGVTDEGYAYAVIEYFEGVWMDELLAAWREDNFILHAGDALLLGRDITDALSSGHSAGLIHHDLRPENILITDPDSRPVLIDLGVPVTSNTRDDVLADSNSNMLDYASPEEMEGKSIGRRSNIYSMGIILYELLTGHRPELPTSSWDIFEHSTMPKEVPLEEARTDLAGETYRLVRNCLWRQEWSRFETADEVISAIDTAILAEQTVPSEAMWSGNRRRWLYLAVPALALLVLIVGLFLLWSQYVSANQQEQAASGTAVAAEVEDVSTAGAAGTIGDEPGPSAEEVNLPAPTEPLFTATPTATMTLEAPPTTENTTVPVYGPPADQEFEPNATISFAWIWLGQTDPGDLFTIYILSEDDEMEPIAIGSVSEPDNATLYRLDTNAADLDLSAGPYLWQVRLENQDSGELIGESDLRRFFVAEVPTPTPTVTATEAPPTATESAASETPVPLTPTEETAVCVTERPPGWLDHRIQLGESLSQFAQSANVDVQKIFDANCLPSGTVLSVGQLVFIPPPLATATFTPAPATPTWTPAPSGSGGSGSGGSDGPRPTKTSIPDPEE